MKTGTILLAATLSFALLHAPCSSGQSNVVFYGAITNVLNVAFADTNLSASVRTSIVSDLQLCLREWGRNSALRLRNEDGSAGYLYNFKQCPYYPEVGVTFPKNVVSNETGGVSLQISRDLSTAYTNAFAFAAANSNVVTAAYEFVAFVSSTNFLNVTSNQIANYILYNQAPPELYQLAFADITNSLRKQTFHPPSILGFHYSPVGPSPTNLWVLVPSSGIPYGNVVAWNQFPAIWHDGKWKFCFWDENPRYALP